MSVNPRLHIEFALMRLSFLCAKPAAQPVQQAPVEQPSPVEQPAPVQTAPAAAQPAPPAEDAQPRERRSRAARAGMSLKSVMDDKPVVEAAPANEDALPSDDMIKTKWPELAGYYMSMPRLASMLTMTTLNIEEADGAKTVFFQVKNDAQKEWVESKLLHELEGNFRKIMGSVKLYLRVQVVPDNSPQEKKIYMPSDQAKELMSQNDEVKNLVKDLGLDIK